MTEVAPLRIGLEAVLSSYLEIRESRKYGVVDTLWASFDSIADALRDASIVKANKNIKVLWGAGRGSWALVPWVALLDSRVASSTSRGVFVAYLFCADMSGVYLTLNQGVEARQRWHKRELDSQIRDTVEKLQRICATLFDKGFSSESIDLRVHRGLGKVYESSTIASKYYRASEIPDDKALLTDLHQVLAHYDSYVNSVERPAVGNSASLLNWK